MLSKKMEDALNDHINAELYAAYLYLSMSAYFESISLAGFAHWMRLQNKEETMHTEKIFDYVNERGGRVKLQALAAPKIEWESAIAAFEDTVAHEQKVTGLINNLVDLALDERDHASNNFLQWFIAEQVEEEASVGAVLDKLKLVEKDSGGLFALDQEMGQRVFTTPA